MTDRSEANGAAASSAKPGKSGMTAQEANERAFVCRTFFARGGESIDRSFVAAKGVGACADWFTCPFARLVWTAAEEAFAKSERGTVTLQGIVSAANRLARASKDDDLKGVRVVNEDFQRIREWVDADKDLSAYARELRNAMVERKVRELFSKTAEDMAASGDATLAVSRMIAEARDILDSKGVCRRMGIGDLCDKALADWDEAYHQRTELGNYEWCPGLPLPWRKLAFTLNGFTPDVTILAARPGVGKTSMALNFSRFWLDAGKKVVFVSVDMSPIGFVKRQLSERAGVSMRKLQFGKSNFYKADREKVVAEIEQLKGLERDGNFVGLVEHDVDAVRAACTILKDQGKIDVLVVDYLQLLSFRGAERVSSVQKATYVSNALHSLAVDLQIPVLCLSQLNRENTKDGGRDPQLSDLRDSGAIEQDAANVLLLYRNDALNRKWHDAEPPVQFAKGKQPSPSLASYCPIWCLVAKCREGDAGTKLPFVVVQNKYSWHLGDYQAKGDEQFLRVYDDWRHDPMEAVWDENGSLIRMADVRAVERANINAERERAGLAPIAWED